jgi:hypothetical protein
LFDAALTGGAVHLLCDTGQDHPDQKSGNEDPNLTEQAMAALVKYQHQHAYQPKAEVGDQRIIHG